MAERLIAESGKDIGIHFTGLRNGEKLHEVLFSDLEDRAPSAHRLINSVQVPALDPADVPEQPDGREAVLALLEQNRDREMVVSARTAGYQEQAFNTPEEEENR